MDLENDKPLSDLYQLFLIGKLTKKEFEGLAFQYLLDNYDRYRQFGGNRENWNEFLSWLYPRLSRAIDLYRDLGSSFDAYITSLVHNAAREYRSREADHSLAEFVCWKARAEEMLLHENEPEYSESSSDFSLPADVNPRQVLLLLLKSYFFVSDDFVKKVANTIGMNAGDIQDMINELRSRRAEKEAKIHNLKGRLHCQHYRCLTYQRRLSGTPYGTANYEKMKARVERAEKRFYAMKKRLSGMRMTASNRMIAEVLGIPRGTVDSSLSSIKNRLVSTVSTTK